MSRILRADAPDGVVAIAPLGQGLGGWSAPFLVRASDEHRYWCKVINNPQNRRVPINEQLVGRLGQLIDAPICPVTLIQIPQELAGWQFCPWDSSLQLEPGWAHGSAEVPDAIEARTMRFRARDDNAKRHAGLYALWDWLCGEDPQWLVRGEQEDAYFSHDHGSYFPGGPAWTVDSLRAYGVRPRRLPVPSDGLDPDELTRMAGRLDDLGSNELEAVASNLPASWPVSDHELEAMVCFLMERRGGTAERLRAMISAR